jgi:phage gp46-like protein
MAVLLSWSEEGGDICVLDGPIVTADSLATELLVHLYTDRAPGTGDPVPEGVVRRGNWQRSFDADACKGSKLWMLPYVRPLSRALALASSWAQEAVEPLVTRKRVRSIVTSAERLGREAIGITLDVRIDADTQRKFRAKVSYGV